MTGHHRVEINGIDPLGRRLVPSRRLVADPLPRRRETVGFEAGPAAVPVEADLAKAGWGVLWGPGTRGQVRRALEPLLRHRRRQAGPRYRDDLVWNGRRSLAAWIRQQRERGGLPQYLLIVGDAADVPFEVEYRLAKGAAVGRIAFATPAEYHAYASQLVAHERGRATRARRSLAIFAPRLRHDSATRLISDDLCVPLARWYRHRGQSTALIGAAATKAGLTAMLRRPPAILLAASHGFARLEDYYDISDPALRRLADKLVPWSVPLAREENGALICQDWSGFEPNGIVPRAVPTPEVYFAGRDVPSTARLRGMVAILVACFSGATPKLATYGPPGRRPPRIADRSFLARLPQCLLRRGAVAVVAHVEQASADTLRVAPAVSRLATFRRFIGRLEGGERVGAAMGEFRARTEYYAAMVRSLASRRGGRAVQSRLAAAQFAFDDARNFILVGDPAGIVAPARRLRAQTRPDPTPKGSTPMATKHLEAFVQRAIRDAAFRAKIAKDPAGALRDMKIRADRRKIAALKALPTVKLQRFAKAFGHKSLPIN